MKHVTLISTFLLITLVFATSVSALSYSTYGDYYLDDVEYYYNNVGRYHDAYDRYNYYPQSDSRYSPYTGSYSSPYSERWYYTPYTSQSRNTQSFQSPYQYYNPHPSTAGYATEPTYYPPLQGYYPPPSYSYTTVNPNRYSAFTYDYSDTGYVRTPSTLTRNANFYPDRSRYTQFTYDGY
jgi:hypothetical protein